jgi:hypothetical protein
MWRSEFGEDMSYEEILDLISNWTLLAQDDRGKGAYHPESALLLPWVLLVIRRGFVAGDDLVDI